GPYEMRVSGDGERVVGDVLVGELWLGSGQSNMQITVRAALDGGAPISAADCAQLRTFVVEEETSPIPLDDVQGARGVCTPQAAPAFPAIAYYFARDLRAALNVPVGVIVSAIGGTSIVVWLPPPEAATRAAARTGDPGSGASSTSAGGGQPFELSVKD